MNTSTCPKTGPQPGARQRTPARKVGQGLVCGCGTGQGAWLCPVPPPLDNSSGLRKGKAKAKKGNRYLGGLASETAVAAGKTQTREGARYRRRAGLTPVLQAQQGSQERPAPGSDRHGRY